MRSATSAGQGQRSGPAHVDGSSSAVTAVRSRLDRRCPPAARAARAGRHVGRAGVTARRRASATSAARIRPASTHRLRARRRRSRCPVGPAMDRRSCSRSASTDRPASAPAAARAATCGSSGVGNRDPGVGALHRRVERGPGPAAAHHHRVHHLDAGPVQFGQQIVQHRRSPAVVLVGDHHHLVGMIAARASVSCLAMARSCPGEVDPGDRADPSPVPGQAHQHQAVGRMEAQHRRHGRQQSGRSTDFDRRHIVGCCHGRRPLRDADRRP